MLHRIIVDMQNWRTIDCRSGCVALNDSNPEFKDEDFPKHVMEPLSADGLGPGCAKT